MTRRGRHFAAKCDSGQNNWLQAGKFTLLRGDASVLGSSLPTGTVSCRCRCPSNTNISRWSGATAPAVFGPAAPDPGRRPALFSVFPLQGCEESSLLQFVENARIDMIVDIHSFARPELRQDVLRTRAGRLGIERRLLL